MRPSVPKRLEAQLRGWIQAGLITAEQAGAIAAFEGKKPERSWALYGVAGVGVTALATGLVSIVASNWDVIPPVVKLVVYFALLIGVGGLFLQHADRRGLGREAALMVFVTMLYAGIGLVAQIFHLQGDGWQAMAFWLVMTLPAACIAQARLVPHLWVWNLIGTNVVWFGATFIHWRGGKPDELTAMTAGCVNIAAYYVLLGLVILRHGAFEVPHRLKEALSFWLHGAFFFGASLLGTVAGPLAYEREIDGIAALRSRLWIIVAGFLIYALTRLLEPRREQRHWRLVLALGLALLHLLAGGFGLHIGALGSAVLFIVSWSALAAAAVGAGMKRAFDVLSFAIACRFVAIYFEVFGSMLSTGIGLIVSGLIIIGTAIVWHRFKDNVARALEVRA